MECSVDIEYRTCQPSLNAGDSQSQENLVNEAYPNGQRFTDTTVGSSDEHNGSEPATLPAKLYQEGKHRCKCVANIIAVIGLMLVIAALFSVPVIVFVVKNMQESTDIGCVAEMYTGDMCRAELEARQACIPGRENSRDVFVSLSATEQAIEEQKLQLILTLLSPSPSCERELNMFLCTVAFDGLCDTEGGAHKPTREECETLMSTVCEVEYQTALQILGPLTLLNCGSFPVSSSICESTVIDSSSSEQLTHIPGSAMENGSISGNLSCSEGFMLDEELGLCKPVCGKWNPQSEEEGQRLMAVTISAGALGIILSVIVLLLACFHYKTTFTFPGIFIVYQTLSGLAYAIVYMIDYVDVQGLFCSSEDLIESVMEGNETPFCIISAAAFIYISSQMALWWIFHLSLVFCAVFWPYKYQYWKKSGYFKYIHIVMVIVGLLIPTLPVIICYTVGGYVTYTLVRPDCVARNAQAAFYSFVVPLIMVIASGCFLLAFIFWKFCSKEWVCKSITFSRLKSNKRQVELKVLFLLCSYIFIWTDVFVIITATLAEGEEYRKTLTEYFTCEAVTPGNCSKSVFDEFDVGSKTLAYCLVTLYPAIFFTYFVGVKKCKRAPTCLQSNKTASIYTN